MIPNVIRNILLGLLLEIANEIPSLSPGHAHLIHPVDVLGNATGCLLTFVCVCGGVLH